jgi:F-type H+-transporting ATPase subunit epsilon
MLNLLIIEPAGTCFKGEVESVALPSRSGRFTVFPHHAPVISLLEKGDIVYRKKGSSGIDKLSVKGGVAQINENNITLCIEY